MGNIDIKFPKILISGSYSAFSEGWNGQGVYMCSGNYQSDTFKQPIYIGSSKNLQSRIEYSHINILKRGTHKNEVLQYCWNRYNENEGFVWWLLELTTSQQQFDIEQKYLDLYRPFVDEFGGFNIEKGVREGKHSEETRQKISTALKGRKRQTGYKLSDATKRKMSLIRKGKKRSEEFKQKISRIHKGKKLSTETRLKMSLSQKGRKQSPEKIRKTTEALSHSFKVIAPNGEITEAKNIKKFCRDNDLHNGPFHCMLSGKRKSAQGWTLYKETNS
jgi:hypothetical protein